MAKIVLTLRIMPDAPDTDLKVIEDQAKDKIIAFSGAADVKVDVVPVAFGIKALQMMFIMDESKGSTEQLEKDIGTISHTQSVEVTDVRRTIG